jgi:hypothetical protein
MVMSPAGFGTKKGYDGEDHLQFTRPDSVGLGTKNLYVGEGQEQFSSQAVGHSLNCELNLVAFSKNGLVKCFTAGKREL